MKKNDLINNLKDLRTELIDPDIYKGTRVFDFYDTIDSAINLAENVNPVCSKKIISNEFLQFNNGKDYKDYEDFIKESIAHDLAIYLLDKMDITINSDPLRHELMYTGTIYILDKKKGILKLC